MSPYVGSGGKKPTLSKKIDFFRETLHSFGHTALCLSGGASMGMYHIGVCKALYEQGILPRIVSGSSAGSIVGSVICTRQDVTEAFDASMYATTLVQFMHAGEPGAMQRRIKRFMDDGVLLDGTILENALRHMIGDVTFQEAFRLTGRVLNITVNGTQRHQPPRLLNYLTHPNVLVWSACLASCSIPGVFPPAELMARTREGKAAPYYPEKILWSDGSFAMDVPMARLTELFNVNHFVVSQVNPFGPLTITSNRVREWPRMGAFDSFLDNAKAVHDWLKLEVLRHVKNLFTLGRAASESVYLTMPTQTGIVGQNFHGDITITPRFRWRDLLLILNNADEATIRQRIFEAEKATYPALQRIKLNTQFEVKLEDALAESLQQAAIDPKRTPGLGLDSKRVLFGEASRKTRVRTSLIPDVGSKAAKSRL